MGEYDIELLARLGAREAELGPRGSEPLPKGLYHVRADGDSSETLTDGPPVLSLAFRVIAPEEIQNGTGTVKTLDRIVSNRSYWFSKEDDTKKRTLEERQETTRIMSGKWISALEYQLRGAGFEDDANSIMEALDSMKTDDEELVAEMMDAIWAILDGHDFFLVVSVKETDSGKFNNVRPFTYTKGKTGDAAVPFLRESYDRAARAMGIVSEEALASI